LPDQHEQQPWQRAKGREGEPTGGPMEIVVEHVVTGFRIGAALNDEGRIF
jgi:hypothetical protein